MTKRIPLHDGGFISWDEKGKQVVGVFVGLKDSSEYPGNKLAMIQTDKGKVAVACPATLKQALEGVTTGTVVEITYKGGDAPKKKGQSGLKRFEVYALSEDE